MTAPIRKFETGATRNTDTGKLDFDGFYSPPVMERFAQYMHKHRQLPDGSLRDSDNWQAGIPLDVYAKSAWRHFFDFWKAHRGYPTQEGIEENLCALLFNVQGYLHEHMKTKAAPKTVAAKDLYDETQVIAERQSSFLTNGEHDGTNRTHWRAEPNIKQHRRVVTEAERNAYLDSFSANPTNCDGNRHPMMAEADRLTGNLG